MRIDIIALKSGSGDGTPEVKRMYRDMQPDMLMDMIYHKINENISENVCKECPIVEYIGELRHTIKDMTIEQLESEIGVFFSEKKCPCIESGFIQFQ